MREVSEFLWAVVGYWQVYITGGLVTALIIAIEHRRNKTVHWSIYRRLLAAFLFLAVFLAWREQYRKGQEALAARSSAEGSLEEARKEVERLKAERENLFHRPPSPSEAEGGLRNKVATLQRELDDRERRRAVREQLARFLDEGNSLMRRCLTNTQHPAPQKDANAWAARVVSYLGQSGLDASYASRFKNPPPPLPISHDKVPPEHDGLWRGLSSHIAVLTDIIRELQR